MLRKPSYLIPGIPSDSITGFCFRVKQEILFCPPNPCEPNFQKFNTHILKDTLHFSGSKIVE